MPRHPQTHTRFFRKNKVLCKCEKLKNLSAWSNKKAISSKHVFQFLHHLQNSNCSISDAQKRLHEWCVNFQIREHIFILLQTGSFFNIYPTIDRRNPVNQLRLVAYPTFHSILAPVFHRCQVKRRNFHVRSFCSSSLAASLVFTKTTALERFMAESRANKVPRSAFGFFSSWFRTGKWKVEVCGSLAPLEHWFLGELENVSWSCEVWDVEILGYTWLLHARYQFISMHKIREMVYNGDV